jgi:hypothetical protein
MLQKLEEPQPQIMRLVLQHCAIPPVHELLHVMLPQVTPLPDELDGPPLLDPPLELGPVSSTSSSMASCPPVASCSLIASCSSSPELPLLLPPELPPLPLEPPLEELCTLIAPSCPRYSIGPSGVPAAAQATMAPRTDVMKAPAEARPYQRMVPVYMPDLEQQRADRPP